MFEIKDFYRRFLRYDHVPTGLAEWRSLPETHLATATNGRVFADPVGEFTAFREGLLAFYPEDVRLKKMAARCAAAGQAGQYNYGRCVARDEPVAAVRPQSFTEAVISLVYLLNKRYRPFYKWMHRGMRDLPVLGAECHRLLTDLCAAVPSSVPRARCRPAAGDPPPLGSAGGPARRGTPQQIIEQISAALIAELIRQGLSDSESDFLLDHAHELQARIEDPGLRSTHVMLD